MNHKIFWLYPYHSGNSKGLRGSVLGNWDKVQMYIFYYTINHTALLPLSFQFELSIKFELNSYLGSSRKNIILLSSMTPFLVFLLLWYTKYTTICVTLYQI